MNGMMSKGRSSSWSTSTYPLMTNVGAGYNIARGLQLINHGSAFLPAFVIDGLYAMLDESGFDFVRQCLRVIEEHGIREQGIYRNCGVTSKVQKLMQLALDKRKNSTDRLNLGDDTEWEVKTISSAIKTFLRNLPEPLMTFDLHSHFINAAKMGDISQRVNHIHYYVYKLPEAHKQMLELIIRHLRLVADHSSENLMTVGNLGVCFGPTLLRPKEETMAAIMDIKFCNVVVEVLIANCHQVFDTRPPQQVGIPCPPKPSHNLVAVMPPANNDLNAASLSSLSSKSATVSSSSINDSLNNSGHQQSQKSTSTECFVNSPQIISNTPSPHRQAPQQPVIVASVRQRQPPPPIPRTNKSGAATALDRNVFESQSSDDLSTTSSLYRQHHQPSASTSENMSSGYPYQSPPINYNSSVRNYGLETASGGGNGVDNSSDSLNSMGSLDRSLMVTSSHQPSSSYTRTKMSASYAPCYNPMACEKDLQSSGTPKKKNLAGAGRPILDKAFDDLLAGWVRERRSLNEKVSRSMIVAKAEEMQQSSIGLDKKINFSAGWLQKFLERHNLRAVALTPTVRKPQRRAVLMKEVCNDVDMDEAHNDIFAHSNLAQYNNSGGQPGEVNSQNNKSPSHQTPSTSQQSSYSARAIPPLYSNLINPSVQFLPRYSCQAGHDTELSFEPGQIITNVYESKEDGWLVGTLNGKTGLIPANYVEHILGP